MIPSSGRGECRRQPVDMSLSHCFLLSLPPSLSEKGTEKYPPVGLATTKMLPCSWYQHSALSGLVRAWPCSWSTLMEAAKLLTSQTYRTTECQSPLKLAATAPVPYYRSGNGCPERGREGWELATGTLTTGQDFGVGALPTLLLLKCWQPASSSF